ncbi:MAG: phosphate acetyltransferase [Clostridia bacterium]|nr:phosphate acetyltransferase [Clostridia bacterium]
MELNGVINDIVNRAKQVKKKIVLPETTDLRILKAAAIISDENIADIILIGSEKNILKLCDENEINLNTEKVKIIDPLMSDKTPIYVEKFYELRKSKGITIEQAHKTIEDSVYFGVMMVKLGEADGLVSGAIHSTSDTLRPALQIIKAADGVKNVSSFFLMEVPNSKYGLNGKLIFSDCGLIEFPTEEQLCDIAVQSARSYETLVLDKPKVAMLSYSTKGSAKSEAVDKIVRVTNALKNMNLDFEVDGELQLDAAIVEEVAKLKAPNSTVAGHANVLVFPDLEAGNIGYKLVQRFANGIALGPITQGLAKPVNDLSRGCNVEEIIGAVAITCLQAK